MRKLILASASKRRYEILKNAGYNFEIIIPDVDENVFDNLSPPDLVQALAKLKSHAVLTATPENAVILSFDTVVVFRGEIYGKPKDKAHAFSMLSRLSGETHFVCTGVCIHERQSDTENVFYERVPVKLAFMEADEINAYIESGQPMDKAGGYGIGGPGGMFVERIEGDFYTVAGLPLSRVYKELRRIEVLPAMMDVDFI